MPYLLRRLIGTLLVVFVVGGIPWTYFNIKYSREVERELTRLRDAGEPLTIEEMIPEPVPDDQNAAVIYQEVFQVDLDRGTPQPERKTAFGVMPPDEHKRLAESMRPGEEFDVELAREVLARPEVIEVLAKLEEASKRPHCVWPVHWEEGFNALFPHLAQYREAARFMAMRARVSAADGDTDDALRWVGASLRMSKHIMQDPMLISHLSAVAIQAIALRAAQQSLGTGTPSPEAAARLTELAGTLDMTAEFHRALQFERAYGLAFFDWVRSEDAETVAEVFDNSIPAAAVNPYRGLVAAPIRAFDQARFLANWRVYLPGLDRPYRLQDPDATERAVRFYTVMAILTNILCPALGRASMKRDQAISMLDELRIVLDLKMHWREHGSYPATLDELRATLDRELPTDPCSGEAYRYERRGEGFLLYGFGRNMQDDGGTEQEGPISDGDNADLPWACEG